MVLSLVRLWEGRPGGREGAVPPTSIPTHGPMVLDRTGLGSTRFARAWGGGAGGGWAYVLANARAALPCAPRTSFLLITRDGATMQLNELVTEDVLVIMMDAEDLQYVINMITQPINQKHLFVLHWITRRNDNRQIDPHIKCARCLPCAPVMSSADYSMFLMFSAWDKATVLLNELDVICVRP